MSINNLAELVQRSNPCILCPHQCGVRRDDGETGVCKVDNVMLISSAAPHFGEESILVGPGGSGTIFFAGCNLSCVFCQNYELGHLCRGTPASTTDLVEVMLELQQRDCANINLVSPTHFSSSVANSIVAARDRGLTIPTVWNCGGYESVETLRLLEGLVDIYMADVKYADPVIGQKLSNAPNYPKHCFAALREMHRQVGDLQTRNGVATRGLLIRHLILPNAQSGSQQVIDFVADEITPGPHRRFILIVLGPTPSASDCFTGGRTQTPGPKALVTPLFSHHV